MSLYDKIIQIYPELSTMGNLFSNGTIVLWNNSDGKGDFIASWNYTKAQPTQEQLNAIS